MDGVCVPRSCTFEQWATRERERLERLFLAACDGRCFALARAREWDECATLASRWLGMAPLSVDAALYRLNALKAPMTRDALARALVAYDRIVRRLRDEYDLAPDPRVSALATDIAASLRATPPTPTMPADAPASAAPAEDVPDHAARAGRIRRASRWLTVAGSIAITLLLAAPSSRPAATSLATAPVVAIAPVRASSGRVIRLFTVSAPDMVGLAQRAASRLRSTALQPSAIAHAGRDAVESRTAYVGHS
jgi:hypothetical protein